jgi:hypothetical protein
MVILHLSTRPCPQQRLYSLLVELCERKNQRNRTIQASVVRLDVRLLDGAVLNEQSISLGAIAAEDGSGVKVEVKALCESQAGVRKEADLMV